MRHRHVSANGIELHVVEEGEGRPIVFCHGFPELWYSWRHQIPALAAAGYRAVALDMRGYGDSSIPTDVDAYDLLTICDDLVACSTRSARIGRSSSATTGAPTPSGRSRSRTPIGSRRWWA